MRNLLLFLAFLNASAPAADPPERVIILSDRSPSVEKSNPPETSLAVIQHFIKLASLADRQMEACIITFGEEVRVFGDQTGQPTSAFESLLKRLEAEYPKPSGGTPMDVAFEKAASLCRQAPGRTTVLLLSDGQPSSGFLQPDRFSTIRRLIDTQRELVIDRYVGRGVVLDEKLRQFDLSLGNPNSPEFQKLYQVQLEAETKLVLKFAGEFNRPDVRFITVDLSGLPILEHIHQTAGGTEADLIRTEPNELLPSLNNVFDVPGVIQIKPARQQADDTVCEAEFEITTDAMAESAYVAIEFHPAIPDFTVNCQLTAEADGQVYEFDPQSGPPETCLGLDGVGSVVTAGVHLESVPDDGRIIFRWVSPNGTMTVPAATIYSYLRLRDDVTADFRPVHLPKAHRPPFDIAAEQSFRYAFSLATDDGTTTFPIASAEAILRSGSRVVRLTLSASKEHPGTVVSRETALPVGSWDVELEVQTESGLSLSLSLPRHLTATLRDRKILIRLPRAASDPSLVSDAMSHFSFGQLNDATTERSLEFFVESHGFDLPVAVEFAAGITDSEGNTPSQSWCRFRKQKLTLQPGKPQSQLMTIALPDEADRAIVDGIMTGSLEIRLADSGMALPLERLEVIAEGKDIPPEQISFELKRPTLTVQSPWAFANRVQQSRYGQEAMINVDINSGFSREVELVVSHNGQVDKQLRLLPGSSIVDDNGAVVGSLRLSATEESEVEQNLAPGQQARWVLRFEVDRGNSIDEANAYVDISGDGIASMRLPIRIAQRKPLLTGIIEWTVWSLLTVVALYAFRQFRKYRRLARLTTDAESVVTERRGLAGVVTLEPLAPGVVALIPDVLMEQVSSSGSSAGRRFQPGQPIRLPVDVEREPLLIRVPQPDVPVEDSDPLTFEVTSVDTDDDRPEVEVAVLDGGHFDDQHRRTGKFLSAALTAAIFLIGLGLRLDEPWVITELQWCYDAVVR